MNNKAVIAIPNKIGRWTDFLAKHVENEFTNVQQEEKITHQQGYENITSCKPLLKLSNNAHRISLEISESEMKTIPPKEKVILLIVYINSTNHCSTVELRIAYNKFYKKHSFCLYPRSSVLQNFQQSL